GFQGWRGHQPTVWQRLVADAQARPAAPIPPIHGSDRDPNAIAMARAGLSSLGLGDAVRLSVLPLADLHAPDGAPGLLVTNPPYGARVGDQGQAAATMAELGDTLRQRFLGWHAWVLAGSVALSKRLGLRPAQRIPVWNGRIDCRWLDVPISSQPVKAGAEPTP
ncbi:MAG: 23S rRNA (guanine(2445)-N(2))/(guanine(2069)-N(7))-methyltransferase, partial [Oligoflexia bacterium]|nr:23S rRNA (guanine(2445)-N(2))/(guanine(2069)-N(7))-methyltransferase [Oligoflexia bacterium]